MKPVARIVNDFTSAPPTLEDVDRFRALSQSIPGWSHLGHVALFKSLLRELFESDPAREPSLLVCGVYHGLDLAIIAYLAAQYHPTRLYRLTGVDLFSAAPCADWPVEKRHLTWEQAFQCAPPSLSAAVKNCPTAEICACDSIKYLNEFAGDFDAIYLDTSHDEATVHRELTAILAHPRAGRLLAGDDYSGPGNFDCGVARALDALLPDHQALGNRVWLAA